MLSAAPFGIEGLTYTSPEEIDQAMLNRYSGKKQFKVGQTERVVYQKVAGLKRIAGMHSLLYQFCSEGAFYDYDAPVSLISPTADRGVKMLHKKLT